MARRRGRRRRRHPEALISQNLISADNAVNEPQEHLSLPATSSTPERMDSAALPIDHPPIVEPTQNSYPPSPHVESYPSFPDFSVHDTDAPEDHNQVREEYQANNDNVQVNVGVDEMSSSDDDLIGSFLKDATFDIFDTGDDESDTSTLPDTPLEDEVDSVEDSSAAADDDEVELARNFITSFKRSMRRSVLLGILSLYGKVRYTLDHYEHLVALMQERGDGKEGIILPCATTMRKSVFPRILKHLFVKSSIETFPMKKSYTHYLPTSSQLSRRQSEAVVVLPSSWAKYDVRCLHVLLEIACIESCRCTRKFGSSDLRVDSAQHVTQRKRLSNYSQTLWINKEGSPEPSTPGMTVRLHTFDDSIVSERCELIDDFSCKQVRYRGERCTSFNAEIISTINIRYSSDPGVYLEEGSGPPQLDDSITQLHKSCIQYIEKICRVDHTSTTENVQQNAEQSGEQPQTRRQRQRQNRQLDSRLKINDRYLVPSDHVTIVRLGDSNVLGVYVSRFWVQRLDDERNFFLFLNVDDQGVVSSTSIGTVGAPVFVTDKPDDTSTFSNQEQPCTTRGTLPDGAPYYIYRLILYADDFNPRSTLFPKGSVGGLYMSPTSFHVRSRRSQTAIRTVSLTPAGVSTNSVIDFLVNDLVHGCIDGFDCIDAFGQKVKVFLDVMGFIGDYPASSSVVDLKGHNATAPCTQCGFTFNNSPDMSRFAYSTSIHSSHSSYRRSQRRTEDIRATGFSSHDQKNLGMSSIDAEQFLSSGSCPLLHFASSYNGKLKAINASDGPAVNRYEMDGYDLNLIAPDHLITGLFKGVLTIIFLQLNSASDRDRVQICLRASLCEHGFQSQTLFYTEKKKKLVPGLSMSCLYCILTVLPTTLEALDLLEQLPSKRILLNLHRFFALAFWYPSDLQDGHKAWRFVHGSLMNSYHRALQVLASNFVKAVDKFGKKFPSLSSYIDRPNIHRLLELVHHTIPRYNHISYFCELVFESSHQPLKKFLSRNHTLNSHVYAVQLNLAKDWLQRIWALWCLYKDEKESGKNRHYALLSLIRLLGGDGADMVQWNSSSHSSCLDETREHIHALIHGTVEKRLRKWYNETLMTFNSEPSWVLYSPPKKFRYLDEQQTFFERVRSELSKLCLQQRNSFEICHKALLHRGFGSSARGIHEQLHIADIVQVLMDSSFKQKKFVSSSISYSGLPIFFVIGGFISSSTGTSWAIVKACELLTPSALDQLPDSRNPHLIKVKTMPFYGQAGTEHCHYIELTNHIRKVGVVHNCSADNLCVFSSQLRNVMHSSTTLDGSQFFLLTRSMAYPPRRS